MRAEIEENEKLTKFIFHKGNVLVESDKDYNSISRFVRGYEVVPADIADLDGDLSLEAEAKFNRHYYTVDEQGSTILITDINQNIKNEYCYDAFGNILDSKEQVHNRITYTGQQFDSITQQYYLRARFYNPVIYYEPSGYASKPGDADYTGKLPKKSWRLTKTGDGAHLVEKANVKGRINLQNYNKSNTPRYYPYGSSENAGQAHLRLHKATKKAGIRLQGGNSNLTDKELIKSYKKAYSDPKLDGIRGDLRTPNSKIIIATDISPKESMVQLERWEKSERTKIEENKQNSISPTNKCKSK